MSIPGAFVCPLSGSIMNEPVIDREGNSYEKSWIMEWLLRKKESPLTRNYLDETHLSTNRNLRDLIDDFKSKNSINSQLQTTTSNIITNNKYVGVGVQINTTVISTDTHSFLTMSPESSQTPIKIPVHLCCIGDISGSMGTEVEIKTTNGTEKNGLSRMDLMKHALNTIIEALGDEDYMTLVTFTDVIDVSFQSVKMTSLGKSIARDKIKMLKPQNTTNIHGGLKKGLEILSNDSSNIFKTVILLTDGVPTGEYIPPRGHEYELKRFLDNKNINCTINTFGFGYELDSELLFNLANIGHGSYSFIPDAGFVGTIFINSLANIFRTVAINAKATIKYTNDKTKEINIGSILFEQNRYVCVPKVSDISCVDFSYFDPFTNSIKKNNNSVSVYINDNDDTKNCIVRNEFCNVLQECLDYLNRIKIKEFITKYRSNTSFQTKFINDLLKDATGQATEALSRKDYFDKWGKHYIRSLIMAHSQQLCNNFKDPGVQHYSGPLFEKLRDEINDIFEKLPPPVPTGRSFSSAPVNRVLSMASYNNSGDPCFLGTCSVMLPFGKTKLVKDIKPGDDVLLPNGSSTIVTHVLKTKNYIGIANLVTFDSGLVITPWHPIYIDNEWKFPCQIGEIKYEQCNEVYSFSLEEGHIITINNIKCITLGHGFSGNPVVEHEYLGTNKVIYDLEKLPTDSNGIINITNKNIIRDPETNRICGISY